VAPTRTDVLRTKRAAGAAYVRSGSAAVVLPVLALLVAARAATGRWGVADVVVAAGVLASAGPVEWFVHRRVLHAPEDAWTSRRLGTGRGHRRHHLDPPELAWLLLRPVDAVAFLVALGALTTAWCAPLLRAIGTDAWPALLTAWTLVAAGLAHYEWTHLLAHSPHRLRSRRYARLARDHRRHHYRNERYWLGVTSQAGDRLMRTLPATLDEVPRSATARTLADSTSSG